MGDNCYDKTCVEARAARVFCSAKVGPEEEDFRFYTIKVAWLKTQRA